jgi:hypothetical protein
MLVLTVGFQGTAANAVGDLPELNESTSGFEEAVNVSADTNISPIASVETAPIRPRFSQLKAQVHRLIKADAQPASKLPVIRLENHRRDLHRRSNEVESQLLDLQYLLSIQSYGTSFADRLLDEDETYQTKLQQIQTLEAEIHVAIQRADTVELKQLERRFYRTERALRKTAQTQLQQHIERSQSTSTLGLWQEPIYQESLRWLMEHTHERHLLRAREQTLARTLVAIALDHQP